MEGTIRLATTAEKWVERQIQRSAVYQEHIYLLVVESVLADVVSHPDAKLEGRFVGIFI